MPMSDDMDNLQHRIKDDKGKEHNPFDKNETKEYPKDTAGVRPCPEQVVMRHAGFSAFPLVSDEGKQRDESDHQSDQHLGVGPKI